MPTCPDHTTSEGAYGPTSIKSNSPPAYFLPPAALTTKMKSAISLAALAALAPLVSAHGYLASINVGGASYPGWAPFSDPYITPAPVRYTRAFKDNGPVPDFTSKDITCNVGGNVPIQHKIPVKAGQEVTLQWDVSLRYSRFFFHSSASPRFGRLGVPKA